MPCLFIHNLPTLVFDERSFSFDSDKVVILRSKIADAVSCSPEDIQIHLVNSQYKLLLDNGKLDDHTVHVEVDWHAGRDNTVKKAISDAIFEFLKFYGLEEGLDITFRDSPRETFFVEKNGLMVPM